MAITDTDRIDWICKRLTYLEHQSADGKPAWKNEKGCYWPQNQTSNPDTVKEEFLDMDLIPYIDAQIRLEKQ